LRRTLNAELLGFREEEVTRLKLDAQVSARICEEEVARVKLDAELLGFV
jgi:hypothetical protein